MTVLSTDAAWAVLQALASYVGWWQGLIVAVVGAGVRVFYRQQAEQARRRTLLMLVEKASAGTVVRQERARAGRQLRCGSELVIRPIREAHRDGA